MKKISMAVFVAVIVGIIISLSTASAAVVKPEIGGEPAVIRCTCYFDQGYTKSGHLVREGIVAGKEEWLGCMAVLY